MVHGVSRPRSQLVIKIIVAATLTALCMFILRQYDSAGTVDMVYFYIG
jgi:UDP-arabinose 4-epimerase